MVISVKMAFPISNFLSPKDVHPIVWQLPKITKKDHNFLRNLTGDAKNKIMGPSGPLTYALKF